MSIKPIKQLEHVNLRTSNLDGMVEWYCRVLGFEVGPRPDFGFGGAWLYAGGQPSVHLVEVGEDPPPYHHEQRLEHFAFGAEGLDEFLPHLRTQGVSYWCRPIPEFNIIQVNISDFEGTHLHIDFPYSDDVDLTEFQGAEAAE